MSQASDGVGLRFDNYPTNIERFYEVLMLEGCHKDATDRILKRIKKDDYVLLTVMSGLHFNWIITELGKINVKVSYIKPQPNWVQKHENDKWSEEDVKKAISHNQNNLK